MALSIVGVRRTLVAGPLPPYSFASADDPPTAPLRSTHG
jgi:hypothetical protein